MALQVASDFGFEVTGVVAEVTAEAFNLDVNHFLMFREILNENSTRWALLS